MDLKWLLVRRITLVALACLFAGSFFALYIAGNDARKQNIVVAELAKRQLDLQLSRIDRSTDIPTRFPDWDLISSHALDPGQCVVFEAAVEARNRSSCAGLPANSDAPPLWFTEAYRRFVSEHLSASRHLIYRGATQGIITATFDPAATASHAWATISPILQMSALLVAILCFVTYVVVDRALRPAHDILVGLNTLASGDLKVRLPPFALTELNRISQVFNSVTADLERAVTERAELARRLIDMQEQERRHLARELHDEIAQKLTALNALAACIRTSAQSDAPQLVNEARDLEKMASGLMVALRRTLSYLRPQEIDDLGLASSLRALIDRHNETARGQTVYTIEAAEDVDALSPETSAHVYRIVQEGLTNASKHANARTVRVRLTEHVDGNLRQVQLSVMDDGVGAGGKRATDVSGSGLIGIRERVAALRGTFVAGPQPSGGFGLRITFPAAPQEA